jgi:hypothetical protein
MSAKLPREPARLAVLAAAAAWLLHPFATSRMYGAGDALWYANMLADYVLQLRDGVFPVFVGQTEFAFNGAVYPLRVAPMYQHVAGLLDLLTGRSLGFFALQHLTVIVCGVAGIFTCYLTLCRIAPGRRWCAAGFAILYLSCPGLLATVYTQDLYMTWMAVPFAPLAAYGIWRSFHKDDTTSQLWLAAPLAALWWAHAPIALWFTLIAASSQLFRLIAVNRGWPQARRSLLGVMMFALLAQFPFVSVAEVQTPGHPSSVVNRIAHPELIAEHTREAFPGAILPLSEHARSLGDLQLGYAFWAVLAFATLGALARPRGELTVLLACAAALLALLIPAFGLSTFLWAHVPSEIARITYYWPMQRFYLILASLLAAAGQVAFGDLAVFRARARVAWVWMLAVGCIWSLWESRQFIGAASERTASTEVSLRSQRVENLFLTNDSYGLFSSLPPYFSNGVLDPRSEVRLLSPVSGLRLPVADAPPLKTGALVGTVDANPGILRLGAALHLMPGRIYALEFAFGRSNLQGILQLSGNSMFREYSLPSSGEPLAFGSAPGNGRRVDLWTSGVAGDEVSLRFIPTAPGAKPEEFERFGSYTLYAVDPAKRPVEVVSLVPFAARTRSETPAVLRGWRPLRSGKVQGGPRHDSRATRGSHGVAGVQGAPISQDIVLGLDNRLDARPSAPRTACDWRPEVR